MTANRRRTDPERCSGAWKMEIARARLSTSRFTSAGIRPSTSPTGSTTKHWGLPTEPRHCA